MLGWALIARARGLVLAVRIGGRARAGEQGSRRLGFTRSLVHELSPRGVRANCVSPGIIATR